MALEDFWKKHKAIAGAALAAAMTLLPAGKASAEEKHDDKAASNAAAAPNAAAPAAAKKQPKHSHASAIPQRGDMGVAPGMDPNTPHWQLVSPPAMDPDLRTPPPSAHELSERMVAKRQAQAAKERHDDPARAARSQAMVTALQSYYGQHKAGFDLDHLHDMPTCEELNAPLKMAHPEAAVKAVDDWLSASGVPKDIADSVHSMVEKQVNNPSDREQAKAVIHTSLDAQEFVRTQAGHPVSAKAHKAFHDAVDTMVDDLGKPLPSKDYTKMKAGLKAMDGELYKAMGPNLDALEGMQLWNVKGQGAHAALENHESRRAQTGTPVSPAADKAFHDAIDKRLEDIRHLKAKTDYTPMETKLKKLDPKAYKAMESAFSGLEDLRQGKVEYDGPAMCAPTQKAPAAPKAKDGGRGR